MVWRLVCPRDFLAGAILSRNMDTNPFANGQRPLPPDEIIFGRSAPMQRIRERLEKVTGANVSVLILGEGGTGKETLARWIHARSPWSGGPFVKVNCAAIPGTLMESELFGYQKGAFTGAYASKTGRVELARDGTLFLDEIAELDLGLQAKLLQFLQDGRFTRIGDQGEHFVEARVICATNRDLEHEISAESFRPDLFYRINVIRVQMPCLRDRADDIPFLAEYFLSQFNATFQLSTPPISKEFAQYLKAREWPGNIRQIENRIARYVILGSEDETELELPRRRLPSLNVSTGSDESLPLKRLTKEAVREMERTLIVRALQANHWNRRRAAEVLKISYRALIYKIREAGISTKRASGNGKAGRTSPPTGLGTATT